MLIFAAGGKPRTWRKTLEARERLNNKLNSHVMASPGIGPQITVVRSEHLAAMPPMIPKEAQVEHKPDRSQVVKANLEEWEGVSHPKALRMYTVHKAN
jgi:hypothetical protein